MKNETGTDPQLTEKLTVLLEAERAGVVTARRMLAEASSDEEKALLEEILEGERSSCRELGRMLLHIGSKGSGNVGDFADKVMALPDLGARHRARLPGRLPLPGRTGRLGRAAPRRTRRSDGPGNECCHPHPRTCKSPRQTPRRPSQPLLRIL